MSKDLISVINKLESLGLTKEASVIMDSLLKTASLDSQLDEVGNLWAVVYSPYEGSPNEKVRYLLTTKEAAETYADYLRELSGEYLVEEMPVYRIKKSIDLSKSAMYLGEGYLTCDECGTRFSEHHAGSETNKGHHVCKVCSGDMSAEEFESRRSGAHESFRSRRHR